MRYILEISYVASDKFAGWQVQKNKLTYQQVLQDAIATILGHQVNVVASGRTDAGVSALKQIAHVDITEVLSKNFVGHLNSLLPDEIRVLSIKQCANDFHARFSAKQKTYKYQFYVSPVCIPVYDVFATHVRGELDLKEMQHATTELLGVHDFSSFCASGSEVADFVREIFSVKLIKEGDLYTFTICGNGFLYNMVRIIVGTLIEIGQHKKNVTMTNIIAKKERKFAGKTAPAKGLTLCEVKY